MAQIADGIRVEVVGGACDDGLGVGIIEIWLRGQGFTALPLVVRTVHWKDVQHLAGFNKVHVVTQDSEIPNRMVLGFSPNLSAIVKTESPFWTVYWVTSSRGREGMVVCKTAWRGTPSSARAASVAN